jgi:biopolymer transport protein ExbD
MRIAPDSHIDDIEINVIPLIDVMLTLLMFFVLTTTFDNNAKLKITLPESTAEVVAVDQQELVVMVDQEGRYYVGANEVINPSLDTLKEAIKKIAGNQKDRRLILRADGRTTHQAVVTAMDAIAQLGFTNLSIATVPTSQGQK